MALRNRWLDESPVKFDGGGGTPISLKRFGRIAAIVVAILTVIALYAEPIAHFLTSGRSEAAQHTQALEQVRGLQQKQDRTDDRLWEEHRENDQLRTKVAALESARDHDREIAALKEQHAADLAERDRQHKAELGRVARDAQARRAPQPQPQPQRVETPEPDPSVVISDLRPYKRLYVVVFPPSRYGDKPFYRKQFSEACDVPPSSIRETRDGFVIHSDGCEKGTFDGFTVIDSTTESS
jgi:hypothetical protein